MQYYLPINMLAVFVKCRFAISDIMQTFMHLHKLDFYDNVVICEIHPSSAIDKTVPSKIKTNFWNLLCVVKPGKIESFEMGS